jgi:hypothetical protein
VEADDRSDERSRPTTHRSSGAGGVRGRRHQLVLGVEGDSLKTEEKTRSGGWRSTRGLPAIGERSTTDPIVHQLGVSRAGSHKGDQQTR